MADEEQQSTAPQQQPPVEEKKKAPKKEKYKDQGELGDDDDEGHEVVHSDDLKQEDAATIKRVNFMLMFLAIAGLILTLGALFFLFSAFESGTPIEPEPEVMPLITLSDDVYFVRSGETATTNFTQLGESATEQAFTPEQAGNLEATSENRNPTWQVNPGGNVIAYQLSGKNTVVVETDLESHNAFEDQSGDLIDWVLPDDGINLFGLFNGNRLIRYDLATKTSVIVDDDFTANGKRGDGRVLYAQDGTIRWMTFGDSETLLEIIHTISTGEAEPHIEIKSPRFPDGAATTRNSLSPDGTSYAFRFVFEGDDFLGLTSLNSQTVRTVYQVTEGSSIDNFYWSPDSRTIAVAESSGSSVERIVRLDTGPLTTQVIVDKDTEGLNSTTAPIASSITWQPNGSVISFENGGALFTLPVNDGSLTKVIENVNTINELDAFGWLRL